MTSGTMSKIPGVYAGRLSRMVNGKRPWNPKRKARYELLAGNTLINGITANSETVYPAHTTQNNKIVPKTMYNGNPKRCVGLPELIMKENFNEYLFHINF